MRCGGKQFLANSLLRGEGWGCETSEPSGQSTIRGGKTGFRTFVITEPQAQE